MSSIYTSWTELLKSDPVPFLLEGEPWTRLNTLTKLLDRPEHDPEVRTAREELNKHPLIRDLLSRLDIWFETSITRHNDPKLPPHILKVLADLGVRTEDPGMGEIIDRIEARREGPLFSVRQTLPDKGNRKADPQADEWYALPCDSPEITSALLQLGHDSPAVRESSDEIVRLWKQEEDWFCHFFFVESQYKKHRNRMPHGGAHGPRPFFPASGKAGLPRLSGKPSSRWSITGTWERASTTSAAQKSSGPSSSPSYGIMPSTWPMY
jgi:hypothetical protein